MDAAMVTKIQSFVDTMLVGILAGAGLLLLSWVASYARDEWRLRRLRRRAVFWRRR